MNVGILTYYGVFNHGAVLQANALKTVIESWGNECSFLSFVRNYDMIPSEQSQKYNISLKSVGLYMNYLAQKGLKNIVYNLKKHNKLKEYRDSHFSLGSHYSNFAGDAVVIGSDEVFSLEIGISEKALKLLPELQLSLNQISIEQAVKYNTQLRCPSDRHPNRDKRIAEYETNDYAEIKRNFKKRNWKSNLIGRIKYSVPAPIKRLLLKARYSTGSQGGN